MNKRSRIGIAGASALAFVALSITAAVATAAGYMKLGDIKGEAADRAQGQTIEIESWSWGGSPPSREAGSGMATGKRQHAPLTIVKKLDKSSPVLQKAFEQHSPLSSVVVYLPSRPPTKVGEVESYLKYEMKDVLVSSYSVGGSAEAPTESVRFIYMKVSVDAAPAEMRFRPERRTPKPRE